MAEARSRTDALFELLPPNSFYDRPIAERHRLIFYLGHLEAFDWNSFSGTLNLSPHDEKFDKLFAFGIDPLGGDLPTDVLTDWPTISEVVRYQNNVRSKLDERLNEVLSTEPAHQPSEIETLLHVAIEHRLMHAETIAYLLHNLQAERKAAHTAPTADPDPAPEQQMVAIPAGTATLGQERDVLGAFGWDNEFDIEEVSVPAFAVNAYPVTNAEFLRFVQDGGYESKVFWKPEDWKWKSKTNLEHPHFWAKQPCATATDPDVPWEYRGMFGNVPLPLSWPVYVSHAEACAFAKWTGKTLPTEAQWHRAAYGTPSDVEQQYPWGNEAPNATRGNFDHEQWDPTAVDAHPAGASAFGVWDLVGNGWEWTSSLFRPLPGFEPFPFYPGYSANFFDEKHFVMKGGSPRTDACMLRPSFRNWFQPHFPHVYATFRCVEE